MKSIQVVTGATMLSLALNSAVLHAEDMMKVAPENTKVLFENDQVRVLETRLKPGDKLPKHTHPPRVNYFLNPAKERITYPGKPPQDFSWNAGEVAYFEAVSLEVVNIGATEAHNIVVELKNAKNVSHPSRPDHSK